MAVKEVNFETYRMAHWTEVAKADRRFYWAPDGKYIYSVEVTRDSRISCRCSQFNERRMTGAGEVCTHVAEAMEFLDWSSWSKLRRDKAPVRNWF
jgi:hypothetical protein